MRRRCVWLALLAVLAAPVTAPVYGAELPGTYTNPLPVAGGSAGGLVESCADPSVIRGQTPGDDDWYAYCTTDPHNGADRLPSGEPRYHLISILRSHDLVRWANAGDALAARPAWVAPMGNLWAPDIRFFNGRYYLYYAASETALPGGGSAIGVATSGSPTGPWADSGGPVVAPQHPACCPDEWRWVYDPNVVTTAAGERYLLYGSYFGGISARRLSPDGLRSDPASETLLASPNRYEGAEVVRHGGYYYLLVSATNCCNGTLTGYAVFAGRSASPLGPYTDRDGVSLLAGKVGGTPVLQMNGNRWVGPGHGGVLADAGGQDWMLYHAIDQQRPRFDAASALTRRPLLLDPLDWQDGWPMVRGGRGPSDTPQPAPAAQPGQRSAYRPVAPPDDALGGPFSPLSDEFGPDSPPGGRWAWVRAPRAAGAFGLSEGTFRIATHPRDLPDEVDAAALLTEISPVGDYTLETRLRLNVPDDGSIHNYVQAGLVVWRDDRDYVKLVVASLWETRQVEFGKAARPQVKGDPAYGNTVLGPPGGEWTWLRLVRRIREGDETFTAYLSRDGVRWTRGGTWTHTLGRDARIGLVAMGGAGYGATFDYVRVYTLPSPYIAKGA